MALSVTLTPLERVRRAIIELQAEQPFFAHLSMALILVPARDELETVVKTAGVNARGELAFNEKFIAGVPRERMKGLLAHETLHLAFDHLGRLGGRNKDIANIAMDMVVNMMVERSHMQLPEGSIPVNTSRDTAWIDTPAGKITVEHVGERWWEDIYNELLKKLDEKGMVQWVSGDGVGGKYPGRDHHSHETTGADGKEMTQDEREASAANWRQRLAEAATIAKQQGKTPAGMDRFIDGLLQPKVNWKEHLRAYVKPHFYPSDYTYAKPHKKSQVLGVYLPSYLKESKEINVLIDTSGSIGQPDLEAFCGEMLGMAKSSPHVKMTVDFCDTRLYPEARVVLDGGVTPQKLLAMKPEGGGGTRMESGLDWLKENKAQSPVVIVLTDGEDSYKETRRSYPFEVIWCISSSGVELDKHGASYGRKVKM